MNKITKKELIENLVFGYPQTYFDNSIGIDTPDTKIRLYIKECINDCIDKIQKNGLKESFTKISTGNLSVLVEAYLQEDKKITFHSTISKNFMTRFELNVDIL